MDSTKLDFALIVLRINVYNIILSPELVKRVYACIYNSVVYQFRQW